MNRRWTWELPLCLCLAACSNSEDASPGGAADAATDPAQIEAAAEAGASDATEAGGEDAGPDAAMADAAEAASAVPEGFVRVEPGTFQMGSPLEEPGRSVDNEVPHEVTLTHAFLVKSTEVTQAQWEAVMGSNPSYFTECGGDCPVEYVNWWEALAFCNALSEKEGLPACYELVGCVGEVGLDRICQEVNVTAVGGNPSSCTGYRLPTEAEWEYAARAGTLTAFAGGGFAQGETAGNTCEEVAALLDAGWYCTNSLDTPHAVAGKQANAWGLSDTAGNVLEWVWDRFAPYPAGAVQDPTGDESGGMRVLRGGSWSRVAAGCRSAAREGLDPAERDGDTGLRPVRTIP